MGLGALPFERSLPRSVISANVRLALRWRSIFSEYTRVLKARRGSPEKKSVSPRYAMLALYPSRHSSKEELACGDLHFRGIVASRQRLLVRYQQGRARRGHHGRGLREVVLESGNTLSRLSSKRKQQTPTA